MSSSPLRPGTSPEEALDYYKKQYEQLETDLADFQASSKELEEQLERDIEAAEKSERKLKEQVEALKFEVEEWKTKHSKAKIESNSTQNVLEKEITTLREASRTLQLRLRDIEVVNDDYERQARNTESSLEDMESKYNVAIERGVLLEGEVKHGEQEREALRIDSQRLRDELGDLRVENEITLEKLRLADETIERLRSRKPSPLAVENLRPRTPASEASGITPSSPTASTPPPKSDSASDMPTPPSPPLSDGPLQPQAEPKTPSRTKRRSIMADVSATPRPSLVTARPAAAKHSRGLSVASSSTSQTNPATRTRARPSIGRQESALPRSESLYQIRNLRGRMQKIEERVQSARSKLPPSQNRTPRGSPRVLGSSRPSPVSELLPSSVTVRRTSKRTSASITSHSEVTSDANSDAVASSTRRESHVKRLSYGIPRPTSALSDHRPASVLERPPSASAVRPASRTSGIARPSSRASGVGISSNVGGTTNQPMAPTTTPTGFIRPASGIGGTLPRSHRTSASISELRGSITSPRNDPFSPPAKKRESNGGFGIGTGGTITGAFVVPPTPSNKTLRSRASTGIVGARERSLATAGAAAAGGGESTMMPPPPRSMISKAKRASDVGETY